MFGNAKELTVPVGNSTMDAFTFGKGERTLVILPGLTVRGVKGSGAVLAWMYRKFATEWRVYVLDKKNDIPDGCTIADLAEDTAEAMEHLGIVRADVLGVSMGGMIAQYLAVTHPGLVNRMVLGVTASESNCAVTEAIEEWRGLMERDDYHGFTLDMLDRMYSPGYVRRYRMMIPLLAKMSVPKDKERFLRLAGACLTCRIHDRLEQIRCPVFVIGGREDCVVTADASLKIADKLGCAVHLYENLGHAAYEEAADFNRRVYDFLKSQ